MNDFKLAFFVLICFLCSCASLQQPKPEDKIKVIILEHSQEKDIAYNRLMVEIAKTYRSSNDVIQYEEKESGNIICRGMERVLKQIVYIHIFYTMAITVRDEKIRFEFEVGECLDCRYSLSEVNKMKLFFDDLSQKLYTAIEKDDEF